jgi:hypothetical protein
MSTDDLIAFAKTRVAARTEIKGRAPSAMYRRFFPAAEVFREEGWSVKEMVTAFVEGGKWPAAKEDALRQAICRHFRNLEKEKSETAEIS